MLVIQVYISIDKTKLKHVMKEERNNK